MSETHICEHGRSSTWCPICYPPEGGPCGESRSVSQLSETPSPTPSSAEASEDRQGEARALLADTRRLYDGYNLRELLAWRDEVCRYLSALLSPQEGAAAVGADTLLADYEKIGAVPWSPATDRLWSWAELAKTRIEALQRQVAASDNAHCNAELKYEAALQEIKAEQFRHGQTIARAEAAESSLRDLQRQVEDCERRKAELIAGLDSYHGRLNQAEASLKKLYERLRAEQELNNPSNMGA